MVIDPGRKAGALVVLVDGALVLYVERGGRTLLSWSDDADHLRAAADALALAVRDGALGALRVERADGETVTARRWARRWPLPDSMSPRGACACAPEQVRAGRLSRPQRRRVPADAIRVAE